jgi:hypothetical protein
MTNSDCELRIANSELSTLACAWVGCGLCGCVWDSNLLFLLRRVKYEADDE